MNKSVFTFEYVYLSLVVYKETHSHSQYDTESCTVSVVKQNMLYNLSKNGFTTWSGTLQLKMCFQTEFTFLNWYLYFYKNSLNQQE